MFSDTQNDIELASDMSLRARRETLTRTMMSVARKAHLSDIDNKILESCSTELRMITSEFSRPNNGRKIDNSAYDEAFRNYLRHGEHGMKPFSKQKLAEYRTATLATEGTPYQAAYPGASGGYFVPLNFWDEVVSASKSVGPFFDPDFSTMHHTPTGAPLPIPQDNDISTSSLLTAEGAQYTDQDVTVKNTVLGTFKYSTSVLVSTEFVQDTGIPLDSYLAKRFGIRAMRALLPIFTTGVGTTQPLGVLTGLDGLTAIGAYSNDGTSAANTIGTDDIAKLIGSLDPVFYPTAKFMMNSATAQALRLVKDKYGDPAFKGLWSAHPTIAGYEVTYNNAMQVLQTEASSPTVTNVVVAFGAFDRFHIRIVNPVLFIKWESFADYGQVLYGLNYRVDSALIDPTAGSVPPVVTLATTY